MDQQPKITIIIPVYNVQEYIHECIDSALNQTYKNTEIILIDDGSTDGSGRICDSYARKHDNIKVFHKKNSGLGYTRNYGIARMTGEYVIFLDSDDYISSNLLETLYSKIVSFNVDTCKSGFTRITNSGKIYLTKKYQNQVYISHEVRNDYLPRFFGSAPEKEDSVEMSVCGTIYKSDIIKNNNLKFASERDVVSEDIFFNIDYLSIAKSAYLTEYIGYNYRYNKKSLSRKYKPEQFNRCKHLYKILKKEIVERGYSTPEVLRLSRQFFVNIRCCLAQENKKISLSSKQDIKKNISIICNDDMVQKTIKEYPVRMLGVKQALFLRLIKKRTINIIYLMIKLGIIHE